MKMSGLRAPILRCLGATLLVSLTPFGLAVAAPFHHPPPAPPTIVRPPVLPPMVPSRPIVPPRDLAPIPLPAESQAIPSSKASNSTANVAPPTVASPPPSPPTSGAVAVRAPAAKTSSAKAAKKAGTALQQALKDMGYDPGPIDGVVGNGTLNAVFTWISDIEDPDLQNRARHAAHNSDYSQLAEIASKAGTDPRPDSAQAGEAIAGSGAVAQPEPKPAASETALQSLAQSMAPPQMRSAAPETESPTPSEMETTGDGKALEGANDLATGPVNQNTADIEGYLDDLRSYRAEATVIDMNRLPVGCLYASSPAQSILAIKAEIERLIARVRPRLVAAREEYEKRLAALRSHIKNRQWEIEHYTGLAGKWPYQTESGNAERLRRIAIAKASLPVMQATLATYEASGWTVAWGFENINTFNMSYVADDIDKIIWLQSQMVAYEAQLPKPDVTSGPGEMIAGGESALPMPGAGPAGADPSQVNQTQADIDFYMSNLKQKRVELQALQGRNDISSEQKAKIQADIEFNIQNNEAMLGEAHARLAVQGGTFDGYDGKVPSGFDPYKLNQTDVTLRDITAKAKAEQQATEQMIKTREFIRKTTDQDDAINLIQKLDRVAGFDNQGGLEDFERLDAVREFRRTVFETRTQADFAQETLDAKLSEIAMAEYEVGASRVKTGATISVALLAGGAGMAATAGSAGLVTTTAATSAALTTQAATASSVLLTYNISTGVIDGYAKSGTGGAVEGVAKETLPVNTYIAIRDGKGAASIGVGLWQDAGNLLQLYGWGNSLKSAVQAKTVANVESSLEGANAALNRQWKLDQASFLSNQMSAQATTLNAAGVGNDDKKSAAASAASAKPKPSTGKAPANTNALPMGDSWASKAPISGAKVPLGDLLTGSSASAGTSIEAALPSGLNAAATMSEVQAAGSTLIAQFDSKVLPMIEALNAADKAAGKPAAAGLTPTLERQIAVVRGLSQGDFSPIVADRILLQDTGQSLAETMAQMAGAFDYVTKL